MEQTWPEHVLSKADIKSLIGCWNSLQTEALFQPANQTGVMKFFAVDDDAEHVFPHVFKTGGQQARGSLSLPNDLDLARQGDRESIQICKETFFEEASLLQVIAALESTVKVGHRTTREMINQMNRMVSKIEFERNTVSSPFLDISEATVMEIKKVYFILKVVLILRYSGPNGTIENLNPRAGYQVTLFTPIEEEWLTGWEGQRRLHAISQHFMARRPQA